MSFSLMEPLPFYWNIFIQSFVSSDNSFLFCLFLFLFFFLSFFVLCVVLFIPCRDHLYLFADCVTARTHAPPPHTHTHTHTHIHTHTHTHTHIYTCTHTSTHTRTHALTPPPPTPPFFLQLRRTHDQTNYLLDSSKSDGRIQTHFERKASSLTSSTQEEAFSDAHDKELVAST